MRKIRFQIMWNRLIAVVEEQARTIVRAAFSPAVREGGDLSAGIFDREGRMLAQAITGTPGHVNTMATAVSHFLDKYPVDQMALDDVYITNDPWQASGHLHDVTIVSPAFHDGQVAGLFAATVHIVDVGGRGMGPDGRSVYEEGVLIPIMPLAKSGEINRTLMDILLANSREPFQVQGDILAIVAAGNEGARRLVAMLEEFDQPDLADLSAFIIENSRDATLAALDRLAKGSFASSLTIDGYDHPITIKAVLEVCEGGLTVDFAGTSPQSSYGINVVLTYTKAYTTYGLMCAAAPGVPNNYGSMGCIEILAPEGSVLNARFPAPVSARHIIGHALPDAVLGCLDQCVPGGVPAESGMMWNPYLRGDRDWHGEARAWEMFAFNAGGMGARPGKDGLSATAFPSGIKNIPVEAAEGVAPILFHRKELRPDSGGPGENRGGLGQIIELGSANDGALSFQAMFDRVEHPACGRADGQPGAAGRVRLSDGTALRAKGLQHVPSGQRLIMELPGGGGHGDPKARSRDKLRADVRAGYVGENQAREVYGLDPEARPAPMPVSQEAD